MTDLQNVHVVIMMGQSNCEGDNGYNASSWSQTTARPNTYIWHKATFGSSAPDGEWQQLDYSAGNNFYQQNEVKTVAGPELELADRFQEIRSGKNLYIIKVSDGATGLDPDTDDPRWAEGEDLRVAAFYQYIPEALEALVADGKRPIVTVVWIQGESDASETSAIASRYKANLDAFFTDMSLAIGIDCLPLMVCALSTSAGYTYRSVIQQAQLDFCGETPNAVLYATEELPRQATELQHYATTGYRKIGSDIADLATSGLATTYESLTPELLAAKTGASQFLWLDAESLSATPVATAVDKFRIAAVDQSSSGSRPTWNATTFNSKAGIIFDGSVPQWLDMNGTAATTGHWATQFVNVLISANLSWDDSDVAGVLFEARGSSNSEEILVGIFDDAGTRKLGYYTDADGWQGVATAAYSALLEAPCCVQWVLGAENAAEGKVYINGTLVFTGDYTPRRIGELVKVGAGNGVGATGQGDFDGKLADFIMYRAATQFITQGLLSRQRGYMFAEKLY